MTTNEELCTDKEHSLLLKETGLLRPEDADGYWVWESVVNHWFYEENKEKALRLTREFKSINSSQPPPIPTFRLDKVVAKLPTSYDFNSHNGKVLRKLLDDNNQGLMKKIDALVKILDYEIMFRNIQAAANAAAKLLHLLWSNKLIGENNDNY